MTESSGSIEIIKDEILPLSDKPYVCMVLTKGNVKPIYSLVTSFPSSYFHIKLPLFVSIYSQTILCSGDSHP